MYNLSCICFMCLTENQNFTTLYHNDIENNITQQVKYVLPELTISELGIPVHICSLCQSTLQFFHVFKTKCLDNYNLLKNYIKSTQRISDTENIKCAENSNDRLTEQEKNIDITENTEDPLQLLEKREDLKNVTQETINIKEEIIDSDDSIEDSIAIEDEDSHPFQFVKCEVSEDTQDDGPSNISWNNMQNESECLSDSEINEFPCSLCTDKFQHKLELKEHMKSTHSVKLMPEKSRGRYDKELRDFNAWRSKKYDSKALNETIVFAYITNLAKNYKASSLWTKFSMLKKAFIVDSDIDISRFGKVMAFMKKQTITFSPRKAKILSVSDCRRFILEASDDYLFCKVVLIFGLYGACRRDELLKLTVDDIEDHEKYVLVKVQDASRTFIIPDASECLNPYQIYQKYAKLRPRNCGIKRFFLGYRHGKCVAQPAGMHTIGGVPRKVAIFLGLANPENYTGHSLRRSGVASLAAEVCGNYLPTKPIGEEKSTKVVEQPVICKIEVVSNEQSNETTSDVVAAASSSIEEEEDLEITGNINYDEPAENEGSTILPEKSKGIYEITFGRYESWCIRKKVKNPTSEKVLLAYFEELAKDKKPTSLWSYYSMLRSVLAMKKLADISKYKHLLLFLKRNSVGYKGKKSRIFSRDNITRFLQEAKNGKFLMIKVAFIIGLTGACRREELKELRTEHVTDQGHFFRILIPKSRANKKAREFFVTAGSVEGVNMVELIRKYVALRPPHTSHSRFFIVYSNKKCSIQPVGIRTFGNIPKIIATFLKLPNTDEFTGHSFRGSSAALLADTGAYI